MDFKRRTAPIHRVDQAETTLFGGLDNRPRRRDFLELRQRTKLRRLGITRAAAGRGKQRDGGSGKCGNDADHGIVQGWS